MAQAPRHRLLRLPELALVLIAPWSCAAAQVDTAPAQAVQLSAAQLPATPVPSTSASSATTPDAPQAAYSSSAQPASTQSAGAQAAVPGTIGGLVTDEASVPLAGAQVTVLQPAGLPPVTTDNSGRYQLDNVPAGPVQLQVTLQGFARFEITFPAAERDHGDLPVIELRIAATFNVTAITVQQRAEIEIKAEEKQRLLGILPNFYVVYDKNPAPLTARQKWELVGHSIIDPVDNAINVLTVGIQQASGEPAYFKSGAAGFGQRLGVDETDYIAGASLSGAVFPILFHQDPRYFYKGEGSWQSRLGHALSSPVRCRSDKGTWQPCYSNVLGQATSSALSNAYYPPEDREGATLTFENLGIGLGTQALANVLQEFVERYFTPKKHRNGSGQ